MGSPDAKQALYDYLEKELCEKRKTPFCDFTIMKDHETLFRHTVGVADLDTKVPFTKDNLVYMFSCTKVLTCASALRLVEEGKIGLDDPVSRYLPAFANLTVEKGGEIVPAEKVMTVRNLFTMTGGLDYTLQDPVTVNLYKEVNGRPTTNQIVQSFAKRPLKFEPGDRFQYSLCHDVLAAVAEVAADKPFSEYVSDVVLKPLGMVNSSFRDTPEFHKRLASLYDLREDGVCVWKPLINKYQFPGLTDRYDSGGAGLLSNGTDYAIFLDTLACEGRSKDGYQLLKPETVRLMATEQLSKVAIDPAFSTHSGPGYGYGLGVRTRVEEIGGKSPIGEFGWDGAAGSHVLVDPKNHLSTVLILHVHEWPKSLKGCHGALRDLAYDFVGI